MNGSFDISWVWSIGLLSFAFGIVCGLGVSLLMRGKQQRVRELESELAGLQQQLDRYREQVSEHFLTTSELVQKMTDSYRDVYEHLANGSQALCQNPVSTPSLDFTRQPVLETAAENPPQQERGPAPEKTDELMEENESDTCIGDAPHVPDLDTEQSATPRTR